MPTRRVGALGVSRPVSFLRVDAPAGGRARARRARVRASCCSMLESVVAAEGTGKRAAIPGYRVVGQDRHRLEGDRRRLFAPIATWRCSAASRRPRDPRLAAVVVIDEPSAGQAQGRPGRGAGVLRAWSAARCACSRWRPISRSMRPEELPAAPDARHRAHGGAAMTPGADSQRALARRAHRGAGRRARGRAR